MLAPIRPSPTIPSCAIPSPSVRVQCHRILSAGHAQPSRCVARGVPCRRQGSRPRGRRAGDLRDHRRPGEEDDLRRALRPGDARHPPGPGDRRRDRRLDDDELLKRMRESVRGRREGRRREGLQAPGRARHLHPGRLQGPEDLRGGGQEAEGRRAPGLLPGDPALRCSRWWSRAWRRGPDRGRAGRDREALRPRPRVREGAERRAQRASWTSRRSTGSTTSSARSR